MDSLRNGRLLHRVKSSYCARAMGTLRKDIQPIYAIEPPDNIMINYIKTIKPDANNYSIKITYSDNVVITADFKELLEKGVMTLLKNPAVFGQVQIGNKGRSIVWQEQDIDFCADSLRLKFYQAQENTEMMGSSEFKSSNQTVPKTNA